MDNALKLLGKPRNGAMVSSVEAIADSLGRLFRPADSRGCRIVVIGYCMLGSVQVCQTHAGADVIRSLMRQNLDVILIGEIRDEETAEAAIHA